MTVTGEGQLVKRISDLTETARKTAGLAQFAVRLTHAQRLELLDKLRSVRFDIEHIEQQVSP